MLSVLSSSSFVCSTRKIGDCSTTALRFAFFVKRETETIMSLSIHKYGIIANKCWLGQPSFVIRRSKALVFFLSAHTSSIEGWMLDNSNRRKEPTSPGRLQTR